MLISKIQSNVKVGVNVEGPLGPVVLVVGDNMKGKTSFAESIKIGLEGKSSIFGATPSQMMRLAKDGAGKLDVRLGFDNGYFNKLTVEGSIAKASKPTREGNTVSALVLDGLLGDILDKEPKRQREAFLRLIAPKGILATARKSVPSAFQAKWDVLVAEIRKEDENAADADIIVTLSENIREKTRAVRAVVKADSAAPDHPRPLPDTIKRLQLEVEAAHAYTSAMRNRQAAAMRGQALTDELKSAPTPASLGDGPTIAQINETLPLLKQAIAVNTFLRGTGAKSCPVCACPSESFSPELALSKLLATNARLEERKAALERAVPAATQAKMQELTDMQAILDRPLPVEPLRPVGDVEAELGGLRKQEDAWAAYEIAHAAANDARAEEVALVAVGKTAERVVAEILQASVASFEDAASASLPTGWRFKLKLFDGKKAVCEAGLTMPGTGTTPVFVPWGALSGSQQAACMVGLADAWAQKEVADCKVVIIDETWIGPTMMQGLLEGLVRVAGKSGGLTQAFVCACSIEGVARVEGVSLVKLP